jgi:hypothetical protein
MSTVPMTHSEVLANGAQFDWLRCQRWSEKKAKPVWIQIVDGVLMMYKITTSEPTKLQETEKVPSNLRLKRPVNELIAICGGLYKFAQPGVLDSENSLTLLFRRGTERCVRVYLHASDQQQYRRWNRALLWSLDQISASLRPSVISMENKRWAHSLFLNWGIDHNIGNGKTSLSQDERHSKFARDLLFGIYFRMYSSRSAKPKVRFVQASCDLTVLYIRAGPFRKIRSQVAMKDVKKVQEATESPLFGKARYPLTLGGINLSADSPVELKYWSEVFTWLIEQQLMPARNRDFLSSLKVDFSLDLNSNRLEIGRCLGGFPLFATFPISLCFPRL